MWTPTIDRPLWDEPCADFATLRQCFATAQFIGGNPVVEQQALHSNQVIKPTRQTVAPTLPLDDSATPQEVLLHLFLRSEPVSAAALTQALHPLPLERGQEMGLFQLEADMVLPLVRIRPFHDLWFAYDFRYQFDATPPSNGQGASASVPAPPQNKIVMGIGASSITLANLTRRHLCEQTLDLGTGCGVQAVLAARHSRRVLATDTNPRALCFTRFNALLNGLHQVETRLGSFFEPVIGEQFDLVVSNPPFVISPAAHFVYRDGGLTGDDVCRLVVQEVGAYLKPDAICQCIGNWAHLRGQHWQDRLRSWVAGNGCDFWVLQSTTEEPADYARTWIETTETLDPQEAQQRFAEWTTYYEQVGIEQISLGCFILRKRADDRTPWTWFTTAHQEMKGDMTDAIQASLDRFDYLARLHDAQDWLNTKFIVSPEVRITQELAPTPSGWQPIEIRLRLISGFARQAVGDTVLLQLLSHARGTQPLRDFIEQLGQQLQQPVERLVEGILPIVSRLAADGYLIPAEMVQAEENG